MIRAHGSISERPVPYSNHSTAQFIDNQNNSHVGYRIQICNLQTQHINTSRTYSCVAKCTSTVTVIITLKIILNERVGYHFCQVILLFWLRQKVVPYTKYEYFYKKLLQPLEKAQRPPRGLHPQVENHCAKLANFAITQLLYFRQRGSASRGSHLMMTMKSKSQHHLSAPEHDC